MLCMANACRKGIYGTLKSLLQLKVFIIDVVPLKMDLLAHPSLFHTQLLKGTCFLARYMQFSRVVANQQKFHRVHVLKIQVRKFP